MKYFISILMESQAEIVLMCMYSIDLSTGYRPSGIYFLDLKNKLGEGTVYKQVKAKQ
jgi:hypothetical protein